MSDSDLSDEDLEALIEGVGPSPPKEPPPPPMDDAPPLPPSEIKCVACGSPQEKTCPASLCVPCRFLRGDPFRPGVRLLSWTQLSSPAKADIDFQTAGLIDMMTGCVPAKHVVEVRCLRVDAPEWKYSLRHFWPKTGISVSISGQRVFMIRPDEPDKETVPPLQITDWARRSPGDIRPHPVQLSVNVPNIKKGEVWALAAVLVTDATPSHVCAMVTYDHKADLDGDRSQLRAWLENNRRNLRNQELATYVPPTMKLSCPVSLMRIEKPVRGATCEHLQCFDLEGYVHTMQSTPAKVAWRCPVCDNPAPPHLLKISDFTQHVLENVNNQAAEVEVKDDGSFFVTVYESEDEGSDMDRSRSRSRTPRRGKSGPQASPEAGGNKAAKDGFRILKEGLADERRAPERQGLTNRELRAQQKEEKKRRNERKEKWNLLQEKAQADARATRLSRKVGRLPEGAVCNKCNKEVPEGGGVYCGRVKADGTVKGCGFQICWKCMKKSTKHEIGGIRTNQMEFEDLERSGADAWWMHEKCMDVRDRAAYDGEDEDAVVDKGARDDEDEEGDIHNLAWDM